MISSHEYINLIGFLKSFKVLEAFNTLTLLKDYIKLLRLFCFLRELVPTQSQSVSSVIRTTSILVLYINQDLSAL